MQTALQKFQLLNAVSFFFGFLSVFGILLVSSFQVSSKYFLSLLTCAIYHVIISLMRMFVCILLTLEIDLYELYSEKSLKGCFESLRLGTIYSYIITSCPKRPCSSA